MRPVDDRTYRTREFAQLSGVTARALHHYDRLGLLKPKRSPAGYRAYSARDFEKLEQIIALKFIGVPLKKIRFFTTGTAHGLANALRAQRQTLEAKRNLLDQAIVAIGEAEKVVRAGAGLDPILYRRIIEVIEMQNNSHEWNKKYDSLVQAKLERLKSISPSEMAELREQWAVLVGDVQQALGEDPGSTKAQELAARWVRLLERLMGERVDPSMICSAAAYQNKGSWSPSGWDFIRRQAGLGFHEQSFSAPALIRTLDAPTYATVPPHGIVFGSATGFVLELSLSAEPMHERIERKIEGHRPMKSGRVLSTTTSGPTQRIAASSGPGRTRNV